jgi:beta-lactamase regulating signal transducer with metallopeptidase domain
VDTLLRVGLSNAVAAGALAVVAAAVGHFCRRPAVSHALWLLVLLKLVTPPLIDHPIPWAPEPASPVTLAPPAPAEEPPVLAEEVEAPDVQVEVVVLNDEPDLPDEPAVAPLAPQTEAAAAPPVAWQPLALAVWLGGSVVWLALAGLRARRFARLLRYAEPAPAWLQREAYRLAVRLGLPAAPPVRLLPGRVSPMLWAPGWSVSLLLPSALLTRFDADARRALLAHELAHLRRRDHWVRLVELLATALFWWHPVAWWARRELREAEEQCCDAWVLWALPQAAKTYALALVETVDFLSETQPALPALASGMGHVRDLRRRVTMIMQGTTPRALTWSGLLALLGLGAFLLPVMPSWGQEEPPKEVIILRAGADARAEDVKKAAADVQDLQRLKAELEQKRAELLKLEAQLKAAQDRLSKAGAAGEKEKSARIVIEIVDGDKRQQITLPAGSRVIGGEDVRGRTVVDALRGAMSEAEAKRLAEAKRALGEAEAKRLEEAKRALAEAEAKARDQIKLRVDALKEQAKGRKLIIEIVSDGKRQVIELPPGSRVIGGGEAPARGAVELYLKQPGEPAPAPKPNQPLRLVPAQPGQPVPALPPAKAADPAKQSQIKVDDGKIIYRLQPGQGDADKRIADLEKRLDELLRAVKELRGEMHKANPAVPGTPPPPAGRRIEIKPPQESNIKPADPFAPAAPPALPAAPVPPTPVGR